MRAMHCWTTLFCLLNGLLLSEALLNFHWGRCPNIAVQQDFNVTKYLGNWYEQAGYNTFMVEGNRRCVYAKYLSNPAGGIIVRNYGVTESDQWTGVNGTAVLDDPSKKEGKLIVTFKLYWWLTVTGPYWVLATDYDSYTVVYSCNNFLFVHSYTVWFLSRDQVLPNTLTSETDFFTVANQTLRDHKIDPSIMLRSNQDNCPPR